MTEAHTSLFACRFIMQVHSGCSTVSTRDIWLEKAVSLPFAPYVGLRVQDGDWETQTDEVYFDLQTGTFKCYCGDDKQLYHRNLNERREITDVEIAEVVAEYEAGGWERSHA